MESIVLENDLGAGVREIVLNRPTKLNALSAELRRQIAEAVVRGDRDADVRVMIVKGAGRAFSAGADMSGRSNRLHSVDDDRQRLEETLDQLMQCWDATKPVIAQVHGYCMGIATVLCNMCDLVYVAEDTKIGWPVVPLGAGLIGASWAWHIGMHRAKEFSYQVGSRMTGVEAVEMGWANRAFPADKLEAEVRAVAGRIAKVPADLVRIKKKAMNHIWNAAGFRDIMRLSALWDSIAHSTEGTTQVRAIINERGIDGAKKWFMEGEGL